ncbi:sugar ABC transporter ATP-binding protein [Nocardioides sp. YIM 152315]|uniref:sugar ABC transporter ATP-binding protein n=1 Tax=Nocardioides sp. YIM 152315 TaxID=3031760 RepID=UPI0023DAC50B|nr:sugar ABC transporter ATP-binding protein [Nocardioides sp. YIM 152315]MDF1605822.1 sugar ABC transporter ATP-binding protein [Nocardioides sp. YIM 152315]
MSQAPALELIGVEKRYPGTIAVRLGEQERLTFEYGHIHALVGQNGAGKSTIVSLIAGMQKPSAGEMRLGGEPYAPADVAQARQHGVDIVLQEPLIEEHMSVEENLLLGREGWFAPAGIFMPWTRRRFAEAVIERLPQRIDLKARAGDLPLESQKLVEMARALASKPRILIVDELSAAMSAHGVEALQETLRAFARDGGLVIYISHHLDEIVGLCDRVTVMRSGEVVTTLDAKSTTKQEISSLMVGDVVEQSSNRTIPDSAETVLELRNVSVAGQAERVSLRVRKGEVLGLGGLMDCGADALAHSIFGVTKPSEGEILLDGKRVRFRSPVQAVSAGVAYVPADRDREGLLLNLRIDKNIDLVALRWTSAFGFLNPRRGSSRATTLIERLGVRCQGCHDLPLNLSGGNRQKIAIAKWLVRRNRLLILHNPTRGVDIGGRAEIHRVINELADDGVAMLLISDDLDELISMSDNLVIMRRGVISAEFSTDEPLTEKQLIGHMV